MLSFYVITAVLYFKDVLSVIPIPNVLTNKGFDNATKFD